MSLTITCDVEDWLQAFTQRFPVSERVVNNVHKILKLFDELDVKCTFFVLGIVAEKYPEIVKMIDAKGHDVQVHGYSHKKISTLSQIEFEDELKRCVDLIGSIIGKRVIGFRAPAFSIGSGDEWAYDVLLKCGFRYDSSTFPMSMKRYGIQNGNKSAHVIKRPDGNLWEFPISLFDTRCMRLPIGGGGYMRFTPLFLYTFLWKILLLNKSAHVLYFHPYDINPYDFSGWEKHVPIVLRTMQRFGRKTVVAKISALRKCADKSVITMSDLYFTKCGTKE